MMKKLLCVLLFAIILLVPFAARATVGPFAQEAVVFPDDEIFTVWGVRDDMAISHVRLRDLAYILNGTTVQFNIEEADCEYLSYRIIRGEPYIPRGDELQPISYSRISEHEEWFMGGGWFYGWVTRTKIGVSGEPAPETMLRFQFVYNNGYDYFFPLSRMGALLGFSLEWSRIGYEAHNLYDFFVDGATYVISTREREPAVLPVQTLEYLQLIHRMNDRWTHDAHFYSTVIDESVVWPLELFISHDGYGARFDSWDSAGPMTGGGGVPFPWLYFYPLTMRKLGDGMVELSISNEAHRPWLWADFTPENYVREKTFSEERRILIDIGQNEIEEIFLYIGDTRYRMLRAFHNVAGSRRYTAEITADGNLQIRYVIGRNRFWDGNGILIYRSQTQGYTGTRIFEQDELTYHCRILFEFTDYTANLGEIFYYSIWRTSPEEMPLNFDLGVYQMRIDTGALHAEFLQEQFEQELQEAVAQAATEAPAETPQSLNHLFIILFALAILAGVVVLFICFV
jgi:hypothetical protein